MSREGQESGTGEREQDRGRLGAERGPKPRDEDINQSLTLLGERECDGLVRLRCAFRSRVLMLADSLYDGSAGVPSP
jgi:hypothetical protein